MNRFLLIVLILLGLDGGVQAGEKSEIFSIYLVRHAEKETEPSDPGNPLLSRCGELRAEAIAEMLSDIRLEKIYSTEFERTLETARPSAESHQLEIERYDPTELGEFSRLLIDRRQGALVIGHSNTTGVLAGLLAGESGEEFAEEEYDRLYQVVVSGDHNEVYLLHQAFRCDS